MWTRSWNKLSLERTFPVTIFRKSSWWPLRPLWQMNQVESSLKGKLDFQFTFCRSSFWKAFEARFCSNCQDRLETLVLFFSSFDLKGVKSMWKFWVHSMLGPFNSAAESPNFWKSFRNTECFHKSHFLPQLDLNFSFRKLWPAWPTDSLLTEI